MRYTSLSAGLQSCMKPNDSLASVLFTANKGEVLCSVVCTVEIFSELCFPLPKSRISKLGATGEERIRQDIWRAYFARK